MALVYLRSLLSVFVYFLHITLFSQKNLSMKNKINHQKDVICFRKNIYNKMSSCDFCCDCHPDCHCDCQKNIDDDEAPATATAAEKPVEDRLLITAIAATTARIFLV